MKSPTRWIQASRRGRKRYSLPNLLKVRAGPALHGALSPAEQAMSQSPEGAAKVQEFHRQLFQSASETIREDIKRITGMDVREATTEVETSSGAVVQVFTSGTMVQVFLLSGKVPSGSFDAANEDATQEVFGDTNPPPKSVPLVNPWCSSQPTV